LIGACTFLLVPSFSGLQTSTLNEQRKPSGEIQIFHSSPLKMAPNKLIFVTGNANKLREVREILGDTVALESRAIDLPELQGTIEEISKDKCHRAADAVS
jgi:hypothetical protein